jgi:hypothetical protein
VHLHPAVHQELSAELAELADADAARGTLEEVRAALHQAAAVAEERTARLAALEAERDREREARVQAETALVTERNNQKSLANQRELVQHMENLVQMVRGLKTPEEGNGTGR